MQIKTLRKTLIGAALVASSLALGVCSSDGYSRTSVGVGYSDYGSSRDYYGSRRDVDGDGIPNRYDRDKDGDSVPNRFDWSPNNPYRR